MKTIIEAVTEKLSKDPNTRVATSHERQAKPDKKSSEALTSEVTSVTGSLQTPPKRKTKGTPHPPMSRDIVQNRKKNKYSSRTRTTPRKDRFDPREMEASICQTAKIQINSKMKNKKPGSTFKMPPRTKSPIWIKHRNAQRSTKPLQRTYSIESMDSDTDRAVASLNLEEVLNNYCTWNYLTVGQLTSSLAFFLNVNLLHIIHIYFNVYKQMTDI